MESLAAITISLSLSFVLPGELLTPSISVLVMVLNLMIGLWLPRWGCVCAVCRVADLPFEQVVKAILPFYIAFASRSDIDHPVPWIGPFSA